VIRRDESGTLEQFEVAANVMVFEDNTPSWRNISMLIR